MSQLIKKPLSPASILPIVKTLSSLIIHSVFLVLLIGLILFQGRTYSSGMYVRLAFAVQTCFDSDILNELYCSVMAKVFSWGLAQRLLSVFILYDQNPKEIK